jgi:hypothetical protein
MNDLLYSCTADLEQPITPVCATDYGERIVTIILSKTQVPTSGNVPSPSDFVAAYSSIAIYKNVVNGHRIQTGETSIDWNVTETYDKQYRVEGRIRRLNQNLARATEKLARYKNLYLYYITDKSYCFGPYYSQPNFNLIEMEGKGNPPYLQFWCDFVGSGIDYNNKDNAYSNIYDPGSITVDSSLITVDSTTITVDSI